jgi:hypothetical protein
MRLSGVLNREIVQAEPHLNALQQIVRRFEQADPDDMARSIKAAAASSIGM